MPRSRRSTMSPLAALLVGLAACAGGESASLGPVDGRDLSPSDTGRVAVGDEAPDFRLASYEGPVVQLSDFRGEQEVLLVFYRGHW